MGGKEEVVEGVKGREGKWKEEGKGGKGLRPEAKKSVMCYFSMEFSKSQHITTFKTTNRFFRPPGTLVPEGLLF